MDDMVSIIIPVYNLENYIEACLLSVIRQTYTNIEIVIIDDGSTDRSLEICEQFAKNDPRIRVFTQNNCGVSAARNYGIQKSTGTLIAFVDGDDTIEDNYIEMLEHYTSHENCDIVFCGMKMVNTKDCKVTTYCCTRPQAGFIKDKFSKFYTESLYLTIGTPVCKLFRRSVLIKNNIKFDENMKHHEDSLFVFTYFKYCRTCMAVNKTFYNYIRHDRGSATEKFDIERIKEDVIYLQFLQKWLKDENISFQEEIMASEIVNNIRSYTFPVLKSNVGVAHKFKILKNAYKFVSDNIVIPQSAFKIKTKIVVIALKWRLYTLIFAYYWFRVKLHVV